ncbi:MULTISPECIES: TIGR04197 family type VII secretion effector [Bacillus cereus group]|uniref:TIGR04197 family type VII secretion effector n=1 Tax=Bacillus thuringiensis TaxID=1428 RepID=A0AAW4I0H8_BACTU|nr:MULTISPECIES: TIGR04197 family type VII secretion effector [Bacillus cereus group]MBN9901390.1 TIGR04197 family type VII secretion effector [Bacillus thuringiensis]MCU7679058.1 TIGR04197 family type VII secretion effector [Bacillus thuringiensis]MDA2480190.1 TIGR04197 family type VII secretion effector [Bacillus cereus]MDA2497210.1 TIGR04197 family type VII secretion effector [Bacillus cereus]MDY7519388.1 TIGR04197 family type VII secretion effector [Bacillus thuringiensis]
MGQFQSNFQTAEQIATQMRNASDTIQSAINRSITKANRTTLTVNSKAQEANQQALDLTKQFCAAFQQAVDNIHSVANEFERMDNELQNTFR